MERLAVFAGDFSLESAEAITPASTSVLDGLHTLVDNNLLRRITGSGPESRFAMLEVTREYALERLIARDEGPAARRAHAAYFLDFTDRVAPASRAGTRRLGWTVSTRSTPI